MVAYSSFIACALLAAELVAGHGAIIGATGNAGGSGMALGVDTSTPRDGTRRRPFQQDSTRFRGSAADTFGETLGGGNNNLETGTAAILAETGDELPQITPGGSVQMTVHQVNADGAGPYTCMINADGTGQTWSQLTVSEQVPGNNGRNRAGQTTAFPLTAEIPNGQTCTGTVAGEDNVCLVRCQNPARAGPFGGVVPVQMVVPAAPAAAAAAAAPVAAPIAANGTAASNIAAANTQPDNLTPGQAAAEAAADALRRRSTVVRKLPKRSSRIHRDTAAAIAYSDRR
ncbi:hypothetical protein B0A52_04129 [Exophiala mesophila]|uniref:CAS1 appressorium specific protein n=1 Tax=Exophiala mesophila TaxID=212818 RepID=A0A438NAD9_EXOME|nr:hypothetical protein B0A52_04129 [Exophiala mesophila]